MQMMSMGWFLQPLLMSDDPAKELIEDVDRIEEVGKEKVDGQSARMYDLIVPSSALAMQQMPFAVGQDIEISMRVWVGKKDNLIKKASFELNMDLFLDAMPEEAKAHMKGTKTTYTEHYSNVERNPSFAEDAFDFAPPEDAKLVGQFGPPGAGSSGKSDFVGKPAPEFTLKDLDNNEVSLGDFAGQVLIVDFWATWCGPCIEEMPTFAALHRQYKDKGFNIIAISTDDSADKVRRYADKEELNFPLLMADDKVKEDYGGISAIPTTFVVGRDGSVRYFYLGTPPDMLDFQKHVEELLAEDTDADG
jgi:cytochrome c biogenesis protein CcmG/thiol:disulfide interchange protein DsbE